MRNEVSCTTFPSPSWSFCGSAVRLALRAQGGFVPDSWGLGEGSGLGLAADLAWCAQAPPVLRGGRYLGRARSSRQEGPEGPHCRGPEPVVSGRATGALGLGGCPHSPFADRVCCLPARPGRQAGLDFALRPPGRLLGAPSAPSGVRCVGGLRGGSQSVSPLRARGPSAPWW